MLQDHLCQSLQFVVAVHTSCWVAGRTEDNHPGLWGDGCLKLLWGHLEVLVEAGLYYHGLTSCQFHHLGIAHPVRSGDNHLLTIVDECHDGVTYTLLGSVGYKDFCWGVMQVVFSLELSGDGLTQAGIAWHWRIS